MIHINKPRCVSHISVCSCFESAPLSIPNLLHTSSITSISRQNGGPDDLCCPVQLLELPLGRPGAGGSLRASILLSGGLMVKILVDANEQIPAL